MGGNKKMEALQLATRTRLYSSEAEIRKDQEAVVDGVLADKEHDLTYLKDKPDLAERVRTGCLEGIRQGIADFMKRKGITDVRDVFEGDNFIQYVYDKQTTKVLETKLTTDPILRTRLCDTKADSVDECKHIAEVVDCAYADTINRKKLFMSGIISSTELYYIDVPEK